MQQLRQSRRTKVLMTAVVVGGVGIGFAVAGLASADEQSAAPTVSCPSVADQLPAIPAQAQAEVDRNLALLQTQINEANRRLVTSQGEGGPNFINNAILGPLKDKRTSTIDRIAIAIGRRAQKPTNLGGLAACSLNTAGGGGAAEEPADPPAEEPSGGDNAGGGNVVVGQISCPDVAGALPAVPAQAQAEVDRNLAQLGNQINEANTRLANSVGQGGPNFVNNAILGPLKDKRAAAIERIAIAIGRHAAKPTNLGGLAACSLAQ
jgi:F0F1-type ATP synthase membrane subunit b/b'